MKVTKKIVTRFPPSPTGYFHIGSARTALFNHLFAAHEGGKMFLRFEDTDKERSKPEYEKDIIEGLKWLRIPHDTATVIRQSERVDVYRAHVKRLLESGNAYEAEPATDAPDKRVVRFKNPNVSITFRDRIRGDVTFDTTELKDFVIAKSVDEPLYHLAVVIDDHEMGVTHVIRGEDHISNTPRQILILEALGFARPEYAHMPLILAPDRTKLSKRHGAVSVNEYRRMGILPEALVNYLALLGWSPGGDIEVLTRQEMADLFTLEAMQKGGAIFDLEKLKWFNHLYLRRLSDADYLRHLQELTDVQVNPLAVPLIKERARTLGEAVELIKAGEYDFLAEEISYEPVRLLKGAKTDAATAKKHLTALAGMLEQIPDTDFTAERVKDAIFAYATEEGRGSVLWPLRVALSGREKSPDPFVIASLIGKKAALSRIKNAQALL